MEDWKDINGWDGLEINGETGQAFSAVSFHRALLQLSIPNMVLAGQYRVAPVMIGANPMRPHQLL